MFPKAAGATLLFALFAAGQPVEWRGPVSGIIYDQPSRALRPVIGMPGGAYLGTALVENIDAASVAPNGELALVSEGGELFLWQSLRSIERRRIALPDSVDRLDYVVWASNSSTAVIYSRSTGRLVKLTGAGTRPAADAVASLALSGEVLSIAVNDGAARIVVAFRGPDTGGFYGAADGTATLMLETPNPGSCAFSKAGNVFYCLNRDAKQVVRFDAANSQVWEPVALAGADPLADPLALAVSRDGRNLYLAGAGDRAIRVYTLESRTLASEVPLALMPDQLTELSAAPGVFLLNCRRQSADPVWLLDARLAPSAFFVPGE